MPFRPLACILTPLLFLLCSCDCVPDCSRRNCGDDGCGGSCGVCTGCEGEILPERECRDGHCPMYCCPNCTGQCCGDDGCASTCPDNCPAEYVCNQRSCQCEGPVCSSDADCEGNQCCLDGSCEDMICEAYECGLDPVCSKQCGPCPSGTFCDDLTWNCIEEGKCTQDKHCPPGQICSNTYFRCIEGCLTSDTCPTGEVCIEEQCRPGCDDKE